MNHQCERCGKAFDTEPQLFAHMIDHNVGAADMASPEDYEDPSAIEASPQRKVAEPIASRAGTKPAAQRPWSNSATPEQVEERKKQGATLTYHYDGYCTKCGGSVETLTLDGVVADKKKVVVVCWCAACKQKIKQRTVNQL